MTIYLFAFELVKLALLNDFLFKCLYVRINRMQPHTWNNNSIEILVHKFTIRLLDSERVRDQDKCFYDERNVGFNIKNLSKLARKRNLYSL